MKVVVEVVNAADLMPKDGHGSANPLVEVEFDGQRQRTQTKVKDLSPFWNEKFLFNVSDPSDLPNKTINVSVNHDSLSPSDSGHHRQFLGRVRISGASVALSPADAHVQRFPLEKRGLFSHIRGDIGLRVYLLPDSSDPVPAPASASAGVPRSSVPTPNPAFDGERASHKSKEEEKKKKKKPAEEESRMFYSVGARGGLGFEFAQMKQAMGGGPGEKPAATMGGGVVVDERHARAEQAAALMMQARAVPGAGTLPPRPGAPEFGLVETYPPIASRLGYRGRDKISSTYDLVEPLHFLFVNVVKARNLPAMDLTGSLDPYVEVKLGNYKGSTKYLEKNQNPVWRQVFAFSKDRLQANLLEVTVKDHDVVKDDFVGRIHVDLTEVPLRVPPDSPLAPQWYWLEDNHGKKLKGEIMLAVWEGTQADEAFPEAWHSDAHNIGMEGLHHTRCKVYFSPKLVYLRVIVMEAQDLILLDKSHQPSVSVRVQLGGPFRRTSQVPSLNPVWNQEFMLVASEPFDDPLVITVEDKEPIGRLELRLSNVVQRADHTKPLVEPQWFNLSKPTFWGEETGNGEKKKQPKFSSKIRLWVCLELGYHVLDESIHYSSDFQPASKNLRKPKIGILELGIHNAQNLMPMKAKDGKLTDAYCVAKYGPKWVRTRTIINSLAPRWHEQYTWEVFDPCTVLTIAVFDNCHFSGHKDGAKDQRIGKVRIRLSTLETNRVYTHLYPLLVLQTSGLKKTGELHLAVRFTCTAWANMVTLYGKPLLPKMHYVKPIPVIQMGSLRYQAMQIVAARLGRAEPPLRREVVEYMLDVDSHMWSLRRSKANFFRISGLLSCLGAISRWFDGIRNWKNPFTTVLVHVLFLILVFYPELILPTIFLCLFMIGIWNYRTRSRHPLHMDTKLSHAESAHPDELDEEFDTFPTTKPSDIVRMRYDRLRSVAGRVQTVVGDLATQGERAQALLSWRDPRATAIFIMLSLIVAIFLYVTPFQVVAVLVVFYLLRHPKLRSKAPSVPFNFYRRLPANSDMLL